MKKLALAFLAACAFAPFAHAAEAKSFAIKTPVLAQVVPPSESPWSTSAYFDLRHVEVSTVVARELGVQHFIIGRYTLGATFNAFTGVTVWSKDNNPLHGVVGGSADVFWTISKEGARFSFGLAGSSPFTTRPLDFGVGFRAGLSIPIKF